LSSQTTPSPQTTPILKQHSVQKQHRALKQHRRIAAAQPARGDGHEPIRADRWNIL
jgi:hypothetical protein